MKLTFFPKLLIVLLFVGVSLIGMYLHSERWNSMIDGISFITTDYLVYEAERFKILETINMIVLPVLSFLFFVLPFKWTNTIIMVLMCIYCIMILPWNYIDDPALSF